MSSPLDLLGYVLAFWYAIFNSYGLAIVGRRTHVAQPHAFPEGLGARRSVEQVAAGVRWQRRRAGL